MTLKRIVFIITFLLLLNCEGIQVNAMPVLQQKVYVIRKTRRPYLKPEARPYRRHELIPHSIPPNLHPKPIRKRVHAPRRHR